MCSSRDAGVARKIIVYGSELDTFGDANACIVGWMTCHNCEWPHSNLGHNRVPADVYTELSAYYDETRLHLGQLPSCSKNGLHFCISEILHGQIGVVIHWRWRDEIGKDLGFVQ